nr:MAG TPA: hypothetical protein [Caudoviricetes sp.]DAJ86626.1 MAG TPA: hypothetical protein [Caudoviricetes sp.]DAM28152.1 MAG TPA: hypothetical protein [Caudoviricetes sp.]DAN42646.1 MAG TPA: hypothetical protein [Caudoviricetes sp.]DAZ70154.1 MAG TPA: hypothetical protein [Caudoviricetes sp.]
MLPYIKKRFATANLYCYYKNSFVCLTGQRF